MRGAAYLFVLLSVTYTYKETCAGSKDLLMNPWMHRTYKYSPLYIQSPIAEVSHETTTTLYPKKVVGIQRTNIGGWRIDPTNSKISQSTFFPCRRNKPIYKNKKLTSSSTTPSLNSTASPNLSSSISNTSPSPRTKSKDTGEHYPGATFTENHHRRRKSKKKNKNNKYENADRYEDSEIAHRIRIHYQVNKLTTTIGQSPIKVDYINEYLAYNHQMPQTPAPSSYAAPLPNAPYSNAPVPNAPYPNAPVPSAQYLNAAVPNVPYSDVPVPNAPYPNAPEPSAHYSNAAIPNPPYSDVPVPNAPYSDMPVPNVPYSNAPVPNAPYSNAPEPNAPYPNAPAPHAPYPDSPILNVPYPNAPVPNAPVPNARKPNAPLPNQPYPYANAVYPLASPLNVAPPYLTSPHQDAPHQDAPQQNEPHKNVPEHNAPRPTLGRRQNENSKHNRFEDILRHQNRPCNAASATTAPICKNGLKPRADSNPELHEDVFRNPFFLWKPKIPSASLSPTSNNGKKEPPGCALSTYNTFVSIVDYIVSYQKRILTYGALGL